MNDKLSEKLLISPPPKKQLAKRKYKGG